MLIRWCCLLLLIPGLSTVCAQAQVTLEPQTIVPGKPLERELAGGESHTYQLTLTAGQFVRFRLEQRAINATLILTAPDGKQLVVMNLTGVGQQESLSTEAAAAGSYRLTVRGSGAATLQGSYRLEALIRAVATAQDKQRFNAEALLIEANELGAQRGKTAQQVIEKLQQVLPIWREVGEPPWTAWSLRGIGTAYFDLGQSEKSIEYYEKALSICREVKDGAGAGDSFYLLGVVYFSTGRYEKAIENLEQAVTIKRELRDRAGEASALVSIGSDYGSLGRYEKARETFEQALGIFRAIKDRAGEANALGNLGNVTFLMGRHEKAIEYHEQSLAIKREIKDRRGEGNSFNGLGLANAWLGRYEKAIEDYEQALLIYRELKDRSREGTALSNLGSAYNRLGRYDKAIEYLEQGLAVFRERKERLKEGVASGNLGKYYLAQSRYEKAMEYFEQALAISQEVKDRGGESDALTDLGDLSWRRGRYDEANSHYEKALAVAREIKARGKEIGPLSGLGNVYRSQGQYEKATQALERALAIAGETKERDSQASALAHLMLTWKARNQPPLAIFFGKQSINAYQEIRSDIRALDRESQQSFIKSKEETYRDLADLLIAQGRLPEAEQVIRMLKEEEYFEYIRRDSANAPQGAKAQLTPEEVALDKRYREIADQLASIGTERGTLMDNKSRTPEEEQRLAKLDADLVVAGNAFQKFLDQLTTELGSSSESSGKIFQMRESQGLMEDLRELGKGVVALYTLVGEDKYRVILTTADFQKGYEYPIKAADLNRKVLAFREVLQNPKLDPLLLSQELYKILLGSVAKDLKAARAETVMWSLDGVLRYVPVAALNDGKHYLLEQYQNVIFTPASQARLKDVPSRNWNALGLGVSKAHGENIPALPGVVEEMRGIIREEGASIQSGVLPGTIRLDEAFTQESMLSGLRQRPPVVHVASHFQFSPGNETNSALLLGDGTFLSLAQIKSLPNVFGGVELLTLSACNTATGSSGANGKEVEGFGVLAQRQGAKSVVASLWPVADRSTKLLMQEFYRAREAQQGQSKIAALRAAQLKLLRGEIAGDAGQSGSRQITHEDPKPGEANRQIFKLNPKAPFAHPYYWAPFILIGNWK